MIYMIVFVDNQLELADADLIFVDENEAKRRCSFYSTLNKIAKTGRTCMVRSMILS